MMYSILALGAVTLAAAANAKESDALPAITKCQIAFASTDAGCNDIVDFGKCLAVTGIDKFPDESEVRQLAESMLISAQRGKDCKNYGDKDDTTAPKKATLRTTRGGGLEFNVEEGKDVNLFRFRRETVSLFSVSERLTAAESAVTDQEDAVKKVADDLSNYGTEVDKKVSAETETRKQAISALTEELTNKYATIAKLGDATDDIEDLKSKIGEVVGSAKGNADAIETLKGKVGTNAAGIKTNKDGLATLKTAVDKLVKLVPSDLGSQLAAAKLAGKSAIYYKQCTYPEWNNGNNGAYEASRCRYTKKADDSFLKITHFGDVRIISGSYSMKFTVDGKDCRRFEDNSGNGDIRMHVHNNGMNHHRPGILIGYCEKTSNNQIIKKGTHDIRLMKSGGGGDHYYGWAYPQRILIEEMPGHLREKAACSGRACN